METTEDRRWVERLTWTRIPTPSGEYHLALYSNGTDEREHMALVAGDVAGRSDVPVRIHSECLTGDVFGSLRCDCGRQLEQAMSLIGREGRGVVIYLRQEGRGIGLLDKLRAYDLQDEGYDTVDANLALGHEIDEREYDIAAGILRELDVQSVRLLTNNPVKVSALRELGVVVSGRVPVVAGVTPENYRYIQTKIARLHHVIDHADPPARERAGGTPITAAELMTAPVVKVNGYRRPSVTISYAQCLDGSIAARGGRRMRISGDQSMKMTHRLRAGHDAILIGIGTALADDPRLTVRLVSGPNPQPVVVDSKLRLPTSAKLFTHGTGEPWIVTSNAADGKRQRQLEAAGATVIRVSCDGTGEIDLAQMLAALATRGIRSVMVEGGSRMIAGFLSTRLVDLVVVTLSTRLVGGLRVFGENGDAPELGHPRLGNIHYQRMGEDVVLWGEPAWD
ncbi:MAG: GTP cyclohydrolase II [Spirochaetaceae bacterium]